MANINGIMKLRWYNPVWVMGFLWHIINNFWDNGRVAAGYMKKVVAIHLFQKERIL